LISSSIEWKILACNIRPSEPSYWRHDAMLHYDRTMLCHSFILIEVQLLFYHLQNGTTNWLVSKDQKKLRLQFKNCFLITSAICDLYTRNPHPKNLVCMSHRIFGFHLLMKGTVKQLTLLSSERTDAILHESLLSS
jgi:hypothetical protein